MRLLRFETTRNQWIQVCPGLSLVVQSAYLYMKIAEFIQGIDNDMPRCDIGICASNVTYLWIGFSEWVIDCNYFLMYIISTNFELPVDFSSVRCLTAEVDLHIYSDKIYTSIIRT